MFVAAPLASVFYAGPLMALFAGIIGAIATFVTRSKKPNLPVSDDWETRYKALEAKVRRDRRWFR